MSCDKQTSVKVAGITVTDVFKIFPGAKIIPDNRFRTIRLAQRCGHCSQSKELDGAPRWRRHGRIVERVWPDGRTEWACHFCGRTVRNR